MKYLDGNEILLGDRVTVDREQGVVVAVIDTNQYSDGYQEGWGYLKQGALVEAEGFGLVHYQKADEDLILISRA